MGDPDQSGSSAGGAGHSAGSWTLLTGHGHGHVLVEIARNPEARIRDISAAVGLTERTVQAIVADLEAAGYITRSRTGRRTRYTVRHDSQFRHPAQEGLQVGPFLALLAVADEEGCTTPGPEKQLKTARLRRQVSPCLSPPGGGPGCGPGDVTGATPPPDPGSWQYQVGPNVGPDDADRPGCPSSSSTNPRRLRLMSSDTEIRPFQIDMPEEAIADLRRRIDAMRWPGQELVTDRSQGVQLATLQALARYWATDYDWRRCEKRLNALPQFTTEIDGTRIHFIHVRSRHENALPLIMTHGWPGSVVELLESVGPLTDPTAHGGRAEDAFDLVLPSLAGYGFSAAPTEVGWNPGRMAQAWAELMRRLGYTRYVAQGGDVGASVTDAMGRQAPEGLAGIHMNLLVTTLGGAMPPVESEQERAAAAAIATFRASGFGYFLEQATRPQTIGYALLDSPLALAAWMLDHDTDAYYKISRAFVDGQPSGGLTRDHILDNITVYWLTGTGASAARSYWESGRAQALAAGQAPPQVTVPVGFTTFPDEIFPAPRSWVEQSYPTLTYFNEAAKGGHFAAWEQPELFATEIRAAFRSLRT